MGMSSTQDEHADWFATQQQIILSFLYVGERVVDAPWCLAPWLVLWRVTGETQRWVLIGTFSMSRERAISHGQQFAPGPIHDDDAERRGRLPTLQGELLGEQESARDVVRMMATDMLGIAHRSGKLNGVAEDAAWLLRCADNDALWDPLPWIG
jgi:hypothetical protein